MDLEGQVPHQFYLIMFKCLQPGIKCPVCCLFIVSSVTPIVFLSGPLADAYTDHYLHSSTPTQISPQMLLRPDVILADPEYALQLAARLGMDHVHQVAAQKAAQILR